MKCMSAWFRRHIKTRIALQLLLDGLPFLLAAFPFTLGVIQVNCKEVMIPKWLDAAGTGCMYTMMYGGGAVLFALSIWLHSRTEAVFACHPHCRNLSILLRLCSFIPAVLSFGLLIGLTFYSFKNR